MPSATGQNWEKYSKKYADDEEPEKKITPLTDEDIQVLKTYGAAPYAAGLKRLEKQIKEKQASVNEKTGVKVSGHKARLILAAELRRNLTQASHLLIYGI